MVVASEASQPPAGLASSRLYFNFQIQNEIAVDLNIVLRIFPKKVTIFQKNYFNGSESWNKAQKFLPYSRNLLLNSYFMKYSSY